MDFQEKKRVEPERIVTILLNGSKAALGETATWAEALTAAQARISETRHADYQRTRNPIFVWRCLMLCRSVAEAAARQHAELQAQASTPYVPDWCMDYLFNTACRLQRLSYLYKSTDPSNEFFAHFGPLSPQQATAQVPAALGFTRPGWNGFKQLYNDDLPGMIVDLWDLEDGAGQARSVSFSELMEMMGWTDERSARRKISKLRGRVKPRPKV